MSSYTSCACRDCMDIAIGSDVSRPELCYDCIVAECEPSTMEALALPHVGSMFECQRPDAYGVELDKEEC